MQRLQNFKRVENEKKKSTNDVIKYIYLSRLVHKIVKQPIQNVQWNPDRHSKILNVYITSLIICKEPKFKKNTVHRLLLLFAFSHCSMCVFKGKFIMWRLGRVTTRSVQVFIHRSDDVETSFLAIIVRVI